MYKKTLQLATLLLLSCSLFLGSCSDDKQAAEILLNRASAHYQHGSFEEAQATIDTLKTTYPKEYEILRQALTLTRQIEIKQQQRNIAYCDSALQVQMKAMDDLIKSSFIHEKDEYATEGIFFHRSQRGERSAQRCYLRATVDEKANFILASVYYGAKPIKHTAVQVKVGDQEATSQTIGYDGAANYRFKDDNTGAHTEVLSLNATQENGIMQLIMEYPKEKVQVALLGGTTLRYTLDNKARIALQETFELGRLISQVNGLQTQWEKSQNRLNYLQSKLNGEPVGHNDLPTQAATSDSSHQ